MDGVEGERLGEVDAEDEDYEEEEQDDNIMYKSACDHLIKKERSLFSNKAQWQGRQLVHGRGKRDDRYKQIE